MTGTELNFYSESFFSAFSLLLVVSVLDVAVASQWRIGANYVHNSLYSALECARRTTKTRFPLSLYRHQLDAGRTRIEHYDNTANPCTLYDMSV